MFSRAAFTWVIFAVKVDIADREIEEKQPQRNDFSSSLQLRE